MYRFCQYIKRWFALAKAKHFSDLKDKHYGEKTTSVYFGRQ